MTEILKPPRPRKRFAQHFLTDPTVVTRLIGAFAATRQQRIVEIGPGRGVMTDALVNSLNASNTKTANEQTTPITALELDRDLAQHLTNRYSPDLVKVVQGDVLQVKLGELLAEDTATANTAASQFRLIGNLPYNISTPLIFHLLNQLEYIQDMLFMFQKEVVLRLAAQPGNKNYGRLSVMTALLLDTEPLFDIPPQAFYPPPKVDSTVARLTPKKSPLKPRNQKIFAEVVATAFSQRRKTLRNALASIAQPEHFIAADIDSKLRAENLSVEQYIALADALTDE